MKFSIETGVGKVCGEQVVAREFDVQELKGRVKEVHLVRIEKQGLEQRRHAGMTEGD